MNFSDKEGCTSRILSITLHLAFLRRKAVPSQAETSESLCQDRHRNNSPLAHTQCLAGVHHPIIDLKMLTCTGQRQKQISRKSFQYDGCARAHSSHNRFEHEAMNTKSDGLNPFNHGLVYTPYKYISGIHVNTQSVPKSRVAPYVHCRFYWCCCTLLVDFHGENSTKKRSMRPRVHLHSHAAEAELLYCCTKHRQFVVLHNQQFNTPVRFTCDVLKTPTC